MKKMNMVIAQSGGPSMVINGSLVAAVIFAKTDGKAKIGKIYGAVHGIAGIQFVIFFAGFAVARYMTLLNELLGSAAA